MYLVRTTFNVEKLLNTKKKLTYELLLDANSELSWISASAK